MERDGLQTFMAQSSHRILSREEERRLAVRAQAGDKRAHDLLVTHNIRLVYSIARHYARGPLPLDDLIQEGTLGLIHAVGKFDPERGFKFSTYATWWIKQAVQRAIYNKGRAIRLPTHKGEHLDRTMRHAARLEAQLARRPTDAEVAESANLTVEQVAELRAIQTTLSLDAFTNEDGDPIEMTELAFLDDEPDFADDYATRDELAAAVACLNEKERRVIELRYGFDGGDERTLAEVGVELGMSRQRVAQIERRSLERLRSSLGVLQLAIRAA